MQNNYCCLLLMLEYHYWGNCYNSTQHMAIIECITYRIICCFNYKIHLKFEPHQFKSVKLQKLKLLSYFLETFCTKP